MDTMHPIDLTAFDLRPYFPDATEEELDDHKRVLEQLLNALWRQALAQALSTGSLDDLRAKRDGFGIED